MSQHINKIELLEHLLSELGERKEINIKELSTFIKKHKDLITTDEIVDFLEANEIKVVGIKKRRQPEIKFDDPVWLYLKEMGKVRILDKEEELKTAFSMRQALQDLQGLIATNLISIQAFINIYKKTFESEFTFEPFHEPDKEKGDDEHIDLLILAQRTIENCRNITNTSIELRKNPTDPYLIQKKAKLFDLIALDIAKIGLPFKIVDRLCTTYEKIIAKYENAKKTINDVTKFLRKSESQVSAIEKEYSAGRLKLSQAAKEFGIRQTEFHKIMMAFKYSKRIIEKIERCTNPRLSVDEMIKKLKSYKIYKERYDKAKTALIEGNVRFVINVAKNHIGRGVDFLDLIQEGNHALIKAVERFDPTKGYKLSTYAIWWIRQSMKRAITKQAKIIGFPPHKMKELQTYITISRHLSHKLGREPSIKELSEHLGVSEEKIRSTMDLAFSQVSLEQAISDTDDRTYSETIINDTFPSPIEILSKKILTKELREILKELTPKEERVLSLRFGLEDNYPRTLEEIGQIFNLSRERIRQIEEKALRKLRSSRRTLILRGYLKTLEEEKQ